MNSSDRHANQPNLRRWIVMGVSGCGKSEVGRRLAARLGIAFLEGDDLHQPCNIAKMASGIPLGDTDRQEWLHHLQFRIAEARANGEGLVASCSALKRSYRDMLREGDPALIFVHLNGDYAVIASRMRNRVGHFMPPALLDAQFADLQPLDENETGMQLDIQKPPDELVNEVVERYLAGSVNRTSPSMMNATAPLF